MEDSDRQRRVETLFEQAIDLSPSEREAFLARACGPDQALRRQVEALLAAGEGADAYFARLAQRIGVPRFEVGPDEAPLFSARGGDRVGPCRLLHELGRGGMGPVYLAERADAHFEQQVALKLIKRGMDTDAVQRRFLRERQILARLQHP